MLEETKKPLIQVDRLVFDTRNQTKTRYFIPDVPYSLTVSNFSSNLSTKTAKEKISRESYFVFPSSQLEIIRLTLDDLHNKKITSVNEQSSTSPIQENKSQHKNEIDLSPVYELIDERRDLTDLNNNKIKYSNNQFEFLY